VNAPDLFIPLMGGWTYAFINCCLLAVRGAFKPEALSNMVRAPGRLGGFEPGGATLQGAHWAGGGRTRPPRPRVQPFRRPTTLVTPATRQVYGTSVAWGVHWCVAWLILRAMSVPGIAWSELLAYTGYPFVPVCAAVVAKQLGGAAMQGGGGFGCGARRLRPGRGVAGCNQAAERGWSWPGAWTA
jgi:hypothetical protein